MQFFKNLKHNIKLKSFQSKNEAAFECLVGCGFSLPRIRKALMVLNKITMADLSNGRPSIVTASNTIKGRRRNMAVMQALASRLDLSIDQLFPENGQ